MSAAAAYRPAAPHRADVQGLRAVAVLLVVAGHILGLPSGGYVGVDVFFVVSGFLITGLLLREHTCTGRLDLREFFARRVRRLLPAALLVLAATNLAAWWVFPGERAGQVLRDSLWGLGLANVHFAALGTDYSDASRPPSPVQHLWSLAVEEQFYLVWPLLLLALLAALRRRAVLGVAVLVAASFAWSVLSTAATPTAAYFSTPARAWELGAGALLALLVQRPAPRPWLSWTGLALVGAAALVYDERTSFPGHAAALPVLGTVLVLLGSAPLAPLVSPVSAYVGRLSYSLYLWHWPVLVLGSALLPAGPGRTAAVLGAAGALSVLSLHLVEDPVRRSGWLSRGQRSRRSPRSAVAVTAAASLLVVGWVVPGLALRAPDRTAAAAAPAAPPRRPWTCPRWWRRPSPPRPGLPWTCRSRRSRTPAPPSGSSTAATTSTPATSTAAATATRPRRAPPWWSATRWRRAGCRRCARCSTRRSGRSTC